MKKYDKIIIGAGLYGLYAAAYSGKKGEHVLVLECEDAPFKRATYINQARVHMGYHYPRSLSTAMKSAGYFERFNGDFPFCINEKFDQVYATSARFSWTDATQFQKFCEAAGIRCDEVSPERYFKKGMCDGAFLTTEYTYDALILRDYYVELLDQMKNVEILYSAKITGISREGDFYVVDAKRGPERESYRTGYLLNATYASTNQILDMIGYEKIGIKYELCEIILCDVGGALEDVGITVMDGPFFSIMPFGKAGCHSLTSVTFTPHMTSYDAVPIFRCQKESQGACSGSYLANCDSCPAKPESAYPYMSHLARKYMKDNYEFSYKGSLFSMKPILKSSEIDDSRPTVIRTYTTNPTFVSVLSGKINTVYDLDEVL
ncbi:MAG: FAD-binding oxidoreductase [Lachnospiraceae bacterium]|nr:FAD-binding oxidoreductase [Lachnospiraceae bacterium]